MLAPSDVSDGLSDACLDTSHTCSPLAHHPSHDPHHSCVDPPSPLPRVHEFPSDFDCNVCSRACCDPVVTICGHLFCWPCLFFQLSLQSASKECPVCKADVQDKIVPLYGCGSVGGPHSTASLSVHIPCRPSATAPRQPNHAVQQNEVRDRPYANSGICASLLRRFGSRYGDSAASLLIRRRRYNNEKEFVLHWMFIMVASATIAFFLAC